MKYINTFMKYISDNELVHRVKNFHNLKIRITDNLNRHFNKEETRMENKHMK